MEKNESESSMITRILDSTEDGQVHFIVKPDALIKELVHLKESAESQIKWIRGDHKVRYINLLKCIYPCKWDLYDGNNENKCYQNCDNINNASFVLFGSQYTIEKNGVTRSEVQELVKEELSETKEDPKIVELKAEIKKYNDLIQQIVLRCIK
ncbi:hypothetical protein C0416_05520 [bacterium]|nr:hypothetical protein [bacterium]